MPRWEGWNFNRQLLLRLYRHEENAHLQNTLALPTRARASMRAGILSHNVHSAPASASVPDADLSKRSCAYGSLKVGDCVTLSSQLSSEPSVCHVWLPSVRAGREELLQERLTRGNTGHRSELKRCCERENDIASASYLWGVTPASAPFEVLFICFNSYEAFTINRHSRLYTPRTQSFLWAL